MPATVYRGDLAEVTFGHETGIVLTHGAFGGLNFTIADNKGSTTLTALAKTSGQANTRVLTLSDGTRTVNFTIDNSTATSTATVIGFSNANSNANQFATNIAAAVNAANTAGTLFITAVASTATVTLTQDLAGAAGNTTPSGTAISDSVITSGGAFSGGQEDADYSTITFGGSSAGFFRATGELRYPAGMMVGATMRVSSSANYSSDDYNNGHVYKVIDNSGTTIKVTPAMKSSGASTTGDELHIESLGLPTIDVGMDYNSAADASDETVLTDQFVGLAATVTLPETSVNIKRSHVVGVGRDVVVQEPQSMKNEGGSLETMMHSPRWLYYALGNEAIYNVNPTGSTAIGGAHAAAIGMGATFIGFANAADLSSGIAVGDYITVADNTEVLTPYSDEPATKTKWGTNGSETQFHSSIRSEIRRVVAVDDTTSYKRIYVDDPFNFDHAAACVVRRIVLADDNSTGSPNFVSTTADFGKIENRQKRALWSMSSVPTFSLETSIRTRNVDSYGTGGYTGSQATNAPDSANDSKQLTRVFKGCKVKDWELTADQDAEVKMSVNFDALMCYTDTGRLEDSDKGDRFTAHRMFENVGNGPAERKKAGIAPNTEKPFFFYNGTITAFGQNIAQVTKFAIKGNNSLQQYYTVGAQPLAESRSTSGSSTQQVPFGGSRNPSIVAEGAVEYECDMEIIVSDPLLFHDFRTTRSKGFDSPITLHLVKNGAGVEREELYVIVDDYIVEEAPLQIPEDKTPVKSELKIKPKHVKVISYDALLHC